MRTKGLHCAYSFAGIISLTQVHPLLEDDGRILLPLDGYNFRTYKEPESRLSTRPG